jgi:type II secretory pathway component PulJ
MKRNSGKKQSSINGFTLTDLLVGIQIMALVALFSYAALRLFQHYFVTNVAELNRQMATSTKLYQIQKRINEADYVEKTKTMLSFYKDEKESLKFSKVLSINGAMHDSIKVIDLNPLIIKVNKDSVKLSY